MTTTTELAQAVRRGAQWLDAVKPDWYKHVNLGTLRMKVSGHCVLSQVFDTLYIDGLSKAGIKLEDSSQYGFTLNPNLVGRPADWWAYLDKRWEIEIRRRLQGSTMSEKTDEYVEFTMTKKEFYDNHGVSQAFRKVFGPDIGEFIDALRQHKSIQIRCSLEDFSRFIVYRFEGGATNRIRGLDPVIKTECPEPPLLDLRGTKT